MRYLQVLLEKHKKMDFVKIIHHQLNDYLKERNIRGKIEPSLRFNVFKRDCFRCVHCGESPATDPMDVLRCPKTIIWGGGN